MEPADIASLLPDVVRRTDEPGGVLGVLLQVMAEQHRPVESVLEHFDVYVDPYRCPAAFVPFLARWVGYDWLLPHDATGTDALPTGDGPLRHLVAEAAALARGRGTADGLVRMLELALGAAPVHVGVTDEPFHVVVRAPEVARAHAGLLVRIVSHEKPAFVTASVAFGEEPPVLLGPLGAPSRTAPTDPGEES